MPVRVYDIAKKLGIENKDVLVKAKALGLAAAKVPSSSLDRLSAEYLEEELMKERGMRVPRTAAWMGLANFKAFAGTQNILIKPITLIFGANSAGKSSVIHGALLAHEAVNTGNLDVYKTKLGGDSVDLGGFRQYVHRRRVTERTEWSIELNPRNLRGNAAEVLYGSGTMVAVRLSFGMPVDDKGYPISNQPPRLASYDIWADNKMIFRLGKREDGSMQILVFNESALRPIIWAILTAATTTDTISDDERAAVAKMLADLLPQLRFECGQLLPEKLIGQDYGTGTSHQLIVIEKGNREQQLEGITRQFAPKFVLEVIKGVNEEFRSSLDKWVYLGPLRSLPPRHLAFTEEKDRNWFASGAFAYERLRKDENVRANVNEWLASPERLKTPYRLAVERFFTATEVKSSLEDGFEKVGSDIVAQLMGNAQNAKLEPGTIVRANEIDNERAALVEESIELNARHKKLASLSEFWMKSMGESFRHMGQLTSLRDQAIDEKKDPDPKWDEQIRAHEAKIEVLKDAIKENDDQKSDLFKRGEVILKHQDELNREKIELFSDLKANLDIPAVAQRLYETIQNRPEQDPMDELVLMDCRTSTRVSHCDVGIGVSQVLPVLVHAFASKENVIAIEQPEIHLHPGLQAELGDVFIESALGERQNTFLLETHSEHLILRILRRIRETTEKRLAAGMQPITPEDVTVVYVDPTSNGSVIKHMKVTPDGDFAEPWPGGFFTDRLNDLP